MTTIAPVHPADDLLRQDRIPHIWCQGCGLGIALNGFVSAVKELDQKTERIIEMSFEKDQLKAQLKKALETIKEQQVIIANEVTLKEKIQAEKKHVEEQLKQTEEENEQYMEWFGDINEAMGCDREDPAVVNVEHYVQEHNNLKKKISRYTR